MDNFKPSTNGTPNYLWERDFGKCFIGYAARDSFNTPKITMPNASKAVGESVNLTAHFVDSIRVDNNFVIPALVTYTIEPVLAPAKRESYGETELWAESYPTEIYTTAHRDLNYVNRIESLGFDAASLQFVSNALSLILAMTSDLIKTMDYSQLTDNANNEAIQKNILVQAMGYSLGLGDPQEGRIDFDSLMYGRSFDGLIDYINKFIFGKLNAYYWCWDFFPSMYTWAALLSRTWSETKSDVAESTLLTCRLSHAWTFAYDPQTVTDPDFPDAVGGMWTIKNAEKPQSLWGMAKHIKACIEWLAADDSFRNITTTMKTIMMKKGDSASMEDGMTLSKNVFDFYPYRGRQVDIKYEPAMLVAFHNATVYPVFSSDTHEVTDPRDPDMPNKMVQLFYFNSNQAPSTYHALAQFDLLRSDAIYDMPEPFECSDYEAMTVASFFKWMIPEGERFPAPGNNFIISPKTLGNTLIVNASIWARPSTLYPVDGQPYRLNAWSEYPYTNVILDRVGPAVLNEESLPRALDAAAKAANVTSFPMQYFFTYHTNTEELSLLGINTDLTTVAAIGYLGLEKCKTQLVLNGGAYPLNIPGGAESSFMGLELIGKKVASSENGGNETSVPANGNGSASGGSGSGSGDSSGTVNKPSRSEKKKLKQEAEASV